jgi:RNA-directed DNA polymerase
VRRVHIPKGSGSETRPIGIPTLEDKVLQQRVRDGVLRRLIHKWLKAGVMEDGNLHYPTEGTPQGGVISPLLANVYLHEVLDKWFEHEVKPGLKGRAFLVRYADDFVIGFKEETDARRVMAMLPNRFGSYGLTVHPEKTRLIDFRHPNRHQGPRAPGGHGLSRTFDFLGFTHFWGVSRKGNRVVQRKTAKKRFTRSLLKVAAWCRQNRHLRVALQHVMLCMKVRGHYQFYGITGNYRALARFTHAVARVWRKWLNRRSERRRMPWDRFKRLLARYPLPAPRVAQSVFRSVAKP